MKNEKKEEESENIKEMYKEFLSSDEYGLDEEEAEEEAEYIKHRWENDN